FRLDGKRALVTGSGSGIGEAIARLFAQQGAHVIIADIQPEAAERVGSSITSSGNDASTLILDVADEDHVRAGVTRRVNEFGRLDLMVNHAGSSHVGSILETRLEDWERVLRVNATGVFLCAREGVRVMLEQEPRGGVLINMASAVALIGVERRLPTRRARG